VAQLTLDVVVVAEQYMRPCVQAPRQECHLGYGKLLLHVASRRCVHGNNPVLYYRVPGSNLSPEIGFPDSLPTVL
jgi:hypothetical protein